MNAVQNFNKYVNGKIYDIENTITHMHYKGSTILELYIRKFRHDAACNISSSPLHKAMRNHGSANFKISLVKNYPCNSKIELEIEEAKVIALARAAGELLYNKNKPAVVSTAAVIANRLMSVNTYRNNPNRHKCLFCDYATANKVDLNKHLRSKKHDRKIDETMKMIDECCFDGPMPIEIWNLGISDDSD